MNWTKEIPTVDGWYWIRVGDECFGIDKVESRSLKVKVNGSEEKEWIEITELSCAGFSFEFYGPLEEPK